MTALHSKGQISPYKCFLSSIISVPSLSSQFETISFVFKQKNRTKHFCWSAKYARLHISVAVLMISSLVF